MTNTTTIAPTPGLILAIDLSKYKSVACLYRTADDHRFTSFGSTRAETRIVECIPKALAARWGAVGLRAGVWPPPCGDQGTHGRPLEPR